MVQTFAGLGFGFLRFSTVDGQVDMDAICAMADAYLAQGGHYFDTAYTYLGGESERAIREAVVKRHPRDRFLIADKLPGYMVKSPADNRRIFEESKKRCGVDFFDVYLLHGLNAENYEFAQKFDQFGFLESLKQSGEAKKTGFSYHDTPELLDRILTEHPEVDYVQLQINYLDWESDAIQSRKCYEVARRHGKAIIIMEPIKGGTLVNLPEEAGKILHDVNPGESPAAFALRFARNLPGVEYVLSGMTDCDQIHANLIASAPISAEENDALQRVAAILRSSIAVACTGCRYCEPYCPMHICIPDYFKLYNEYSRCPSDDWKISPIYDALAQTHGKASDCISCRQCQTHCPQKLTIPDILKKVCSALEE